MKKSLWSTLSLLVVLLVACNIGIDSEIFNDESSCKAPCWHQLTPGQSTASDVELFLGSFSSRIWWPDQYVHKYGMEPDFIRIIDRGRSQSVEFYMEDGKLTFIKSYGSTSATLGQIVEHFGHPEYLRAVLAVGPDGHLYKLEVHYPKRGLSFEISPLGMEISPNQPDVGQLNATMPVDAIQYYQAGDLQSYLTVRHPALSREAAEKELQPWPGFGKVNVIETH